MRRGSEAEWYREAGPAGQSGVQDVCTAADADVVLAEAGSPSAPRTMVNLVAFRPIDQWFIDVVLNYPVP